MGPALTPAWNPVISVCVRVCEGERERKGGLCVVVCVWMYVCGVVWFHLYIYGAQ